MKKTGFPTKKTFHQDFLTRDFDSIRTLVYEQASLGEYFEYQEKNDFQKQEELLGIFRKSLKLTLKEKIVLFVWKGYWRVIENRFNIDMILVSIFQNRFRLYESIFTGLRDKISPKKGQERGSVGIESVGIKGVCSSYNMSPTELFDNYTLEQYFWFLDGIEFEQNQITPEGKMLNKLAVADREGASERAKLTKERFQSFKK